MLNPAATPSRFLEIKIKKMNSKIPVNCSQIVANLQRKTGNDSLSDGPVHVGTKMKDSPKIGRFPSERCRNDPHQRIRSHDGSVES